MSAQRSPYSVFNEPNYTPSGKSDQYQRFVKPDSLQYYLAPTWLVMMPEPALLTDEGLQAYKEAEARALSEKNPTVIHDATLLPSSSGSHFPDTKSKHYEITDLVSLNSHHNRVVKGTPTGRDHSVVTSAVVWHGVHPGNGMDWIVTLSGSLYMVKWAEKDRGGVHW